MRGDPNKANQIWLFNWLGALERAKGDGRACHTDHRAGRQERDAEGGGEDRGAKGVPVVRLDCSKVEEYCAILSDFEKMAGWAELKFITIDKDRDGFITRAEVAAYHLEQGGTKEDGVNKLFDKHDADKDGSSRRRILRGFRGASAGASEAERSPRS